MDSFNKPKILVVIPARYGSTRFEGKPLAPISGKTLIQRVYERVIKSTAFDKVVVATDDYRIFDHVKSFGDVIMTSDKHLNGTERCAEVVSLLEKKHENYDIVINVQGDEPLINFKDIELCSNLFQNPKVEIATLCRKITDKEEIDNDSVVKLVKDNFNKVLYFSRAAIPYNRDENDTEKWINSHDYFQHIGLYAFRTEVLKKVTKYNMSSLEKTEKLEQLRWLQNGLTMVVAETDTMSYPVDLPEDIVKIESRL